MKEVNKTEDFSILLEEEIKDQPKEGTIATGTIVKITNEKVIVDVGLKTEGIISTTEFTKKENLISGNKIEVFIEKLEDKNGNTKISFNRVAKEKSWKKFEKAEKENENIKGKIIGKLMKGGYAVEIEGILAFLPGSHLDIRQVKNPVELFHIEEEFKILKIDRNQGNIVVSRRKILEESRKEARENMLLKINEGTRLKGIVKNITNYGAFIDLGEIDGLLHMSDISWNRISHPTEILNLGEEIEVIVIKYNSETQRVSLGMKQLTDNPWNGMDKKFKINEKYTGIISEINDFGIFIKMKNDTNIIGLVYPNEISWNSRKSNPRNSFKIDQEILVKVLEIDINKHRLSLSIKKCLENPWEQLLKKYPEGSKIKTKITKILDFGLLVEIVDNTPTLNQLKLLIPATEIDWNYKPRESLAQFKIGDTTECIILNSEIEKEKITLSIKRLEENNIKKIVNKIINRSIVTCKITEVIEKGLIVEVDGIKGFIKKSDLSKDKSQQTPERFTTGDRIDAKAINFDKVDKILKLSIKQLEIDEEKKAISEYGSINSGATLADILGEAIETNRKK